MTHDEAARTLDEIAHVLQMAAYEYVCAEGQILAAELSADLRTVAAWIQSEGATPHGERKPQ